MNTNELTYWVTFASMIKIKCERRNRLYAACYDGNRKPKYSIIDLFERQEVRREIGVTPDEERIFMEAYAQLPNNAFMVEDLLSQGYEILPFTSSDYPQSLKKNLKYKAPCVLYVKGNKTLLNTEATAIVGSRKADNISLEFTTNIAKKAIMENKTVVSGFAKGVDQRALDAAIAANGTSIIVLPQGITTFASGFRRYYQQIYKGKVTVISEFHPKAPWSVGLAMDRNSTIYGLATEIYAAQSDTKGGTWSGVTKGLKKIKELEEHGYKSGQKIYVRIPSADEKNANMALIQMGGIGVDLYGNVVAPSYCDSVTSYDYVSEPVCDYGTLISKNSDDSEDEFKKRILDFLIEKKSSKAILEFLKIDWSDKKMKNYLRSLAEVDEITINRRVYFFKKGNKQSSLFENM